MGFPWLNMLLLLLLLLYYYYYYYIKKNRRKEKEKSTQNIQQNTKNHVALHCINPFLFFVGCMTVLTTILACLKINPASSQFVTKSCFKIIIFVTVQAFCTQQICTMYTAFCTLFAVCGLHFELTIKISQELYRIKVQLNTV